MTPQAGCFAQIDIRGENSGPPIGELRQHDLTQLPIESYETFLLTQALAVRGIAQDRAGLLADNARLRSQLSSASTNVRISGAATATLGLAPADPSTTTYVRLGKK